MEQHETDLLRELKALRKGRAVSTPRILDQVGPNLRILAGIGPDDSAGIARHKVTSTLGALAELLPTDLSLAARAALALHPEAQQPFLADRVQWLAERLERDVRTARRRVDLGLAAMAERAATPADPTVPASSAPQAARDAGDDWYVREFRALLRLDQPAPEAMEHRVIVANKDGLDAVEALITIPRDRTARTASHDLSVEVLYGATITSRERVTASRFKFGLELPRALHAGETHEYALLFRLPADQPMRSHYVYRTHRRCDAFDLRIRFHPARLPREIWRITDGYAGDLDDESPPRDSVELDRSGELHLAFHRLRLGLGYGAQWKPSPSHESRHGRTAGPPASGEDPGDRGPPT